MGHCKVLITSQMEVQIPFIQFAVLILNAFVDNTIRHDAAVFAQMIDTTQVTV